MLLVAVEDLSLLRDPFLAPLLLMLSILPAPSPAPALASLPTDPIDFAVGVFSFHAATMFRTDVIGDRALSGAVRRREDAVGIGVGV